MKQSVGSDYDRLFYPFLFEGGQANLDEVLVQVRQSILAKSSELIALRRLTLETQRGAIVAAGQAMAAAFGRGATLFAFGNGGSATDAQDLVADLLNPPCAEWASLPAMTLTNDAATLTAVANDVGVVNIFTRQIIAFGQPGDIAVGFSTSGNSANVLAALVQAHKQGLLTIALAGYDGGQLAQSSATDFCLIAPSDHIPRIQEAQATVYHALLEVVQQLLKNDQREVQP